MSGFLLRCEAYCSALSSRHIDPYFHRVTVFYRKTSLQNEPHAVMFRSGSFCFIFNVSFAIRAPMWYDKNSFCKKFATKRPVRALYI